ncbi:MAG: hypothetical protein ACFFDI_10645 [Promethearchaeota archaeon]
MNFSKLHFSAGEKPHNLQAELYYLGNDLIVHLSGEGAHIGAVALAEPYKSDKRLSACVSVLSAYGHKDEAILREGALLLAKHLKVRVIVVGGVHLDNASYEDINQIIANSKLIFDKIINYFKKKLSSPESKS